MNRSEKQMVDLLRRGAESWGYVSVKAELEAEGTRRDELLRLLDVAHAAGLGLTMKIGGCEAISDLDDVRRFGARWVVAPMVETPYALTKYVAARTKVYEGEVPGDTGFLFNIETQHAFECREELYRVAAGGGLDGVVFGRSDFAASRQIPSQVNSRSVTESVLTVAGECALWGLDLVVGGGISVDSVPALRLVADTHLTRFETRKVVFAATRALRAKDLEEGLVAAARFELLWLANKRDHYQRLAGEDRARIATLEQRWQFLSSSV